MKILTNFIFVLYSCILLACEQEAKINSANKLYMAAKVNYEQEQYQEALENLNKAIEYNPDFANAYNLRGQVRFKTGKHGDALNDYSKAIEINPDYAEAYYNRGNAHNILQGMFKATAGCSDIKKAKELGYKLPEDQYVWDCD